MRTYGVAPIMSGSGMSAAIMPFYSAEAQNSLERGKDRRRQVMI